MSLFSHLLQQLNGSIYEGCKTDEDYTNRSLAYVEKVLLKDHIVSNTRTYTKGKQNGIRNENIEQAR